MVFHSAIQVEIVRRLVQDRLAGAERDRGFQARPRRASRDSSMRDPVGKLRVLLRRAFGSRGVPGKQSELERPFLIRQSRAGDSAALERLAKLDSRTLPDGSFLLAEIHGEIVAAAPIDGDAEPFGDPFRPTADIRELLKLQARYARRQRAGSAPDARTPRRSVQDAA